MPAKKSTKKTKPSQGAPAPEPAPPMEGPGAGEAEGGAWPAPPTPSDPPPPKAPRPDPAPEPAQPDPIHAAAPVPHVPPPREPEPPQPDPIHAAAPDPPTWAPPMAPPPPGDADGAVARTATTRVGLPWASHIGFSVAALGLALITLSYWWAATYWPDNLNPGGVSGIRLGLGLFIPGLIAGVAFLFVPPRRDAGFPLDAPPSAWRRRADEVDYMRKVALGLWWGGVGLTLIGLLVALLAWRDAMLAGPDAQSVVVLGTSATYATLSGIGLALAVAGVALWAGFALRVNALQEALRGYAVTSQALGSPVPGQTAAPMAQAASPAGPRADVTAAELAALMRRIDGLLSALPDEVVGEFSRTPEAETYLKLMRENA